MRMRTENPPLNKMREHAHEQPFFGIYLLSIYFTEPGDHLGHAHLEEGAFHGPSRINAHGRTVDEELEMHRKLHARLHHIADEMHVNVS
jgi:hypothetical protein